MAIEYQLAMPEPHSHLFEVEVRVPAAVEPLELVMPSWTPGSYLIREFPRNVQDFQAHDATGLPLAWRKVDKNSWLIEGDVIGGVTVRYRVYANELSVRTSHLDASHGYVNGASVFMYVRGAEGESVRLRVEAPEGWRVATSLRETEEGTLLAADYDELVDCPLEIGPHRTVVWAQEEVPHRYALWGPAEIDDRRLVADTRAIIQVCSAMFAGLPYDRFLFILHVVPEGRGGLEHRSSCSLQVPMTALAGEEYESLIALVAHEFFHVWLGKRIRPDAFERYDYTRENYTRSLWVIEGFTTYYTDLILVRAGLMTPARYLERLGDSIARLQALPGRRHQSLEESSFDTWIRFYRPDPNTPNAQISYYHKGSLVALALDLEIRRRTSGARSLDDVMRILWERYGARDVGYPEEGPGSVRDVIEEVYGAPLDDFFARYVSGTAEIDFDAHLATVGLELVPYGGGAGGDRGGAGQTATPLPPPRPAPPSLAEWRLGIRLREEGGRLRVTHVLAGTPAFSAGLNAGDEIVAVSGIRASLVLLLALLRSKEPGTRLDLTLLRREQLQTVCVVLGPEEPRRARIVERADAAEAQVALRKAWLADGRVKSEE